MSIVNIKVNDQNLQVNNNSNLLDNLLENGYYIPNLCYNKDLEVYGGCGLCIVEIKGYPKPVRACATKPFEGMEIFTDSKRVKQGRKTALSLILSDHKADCIAPCQKACPTHQDCQGYIGLIANGKSKEALMLIKEDNPLPASIGRVCPHPCEDACRRKLSEEPIAICHLKRFAADMNGDYVPECKPSTKKKVAIVGSGPAGLSCAYFLRKLGHQVVVFEAMPHAGGMLRYGIPEYRLPKDVLDREINAIINMGAEIRYNCKIGKDISIDALKKDYDVVFVAVGAWKSTSLGCENDDLPNVIGGIDFLIRVAQGESVKLGKKVAVVGGGNTAIDAARTALRLGASDVTLIYRRTESEMPAEEIEIREAKEEGIKFSFLSSPIAVCSKDSCVLLDLQKMKLGEPDASGRCSPIPITGDIEKLEFDTVISAIGQKVEGQGLEEINSTKWGTLIVDPSTFQTNVEGVFAGGDAVNNGPDIAISAIAHGKNASYVMDSYLKGEIKPFTDKFYVERKNFTKDDLNVVDYQPRIERSEVEPDKRKNNFMEFVKGYSEEEAIDEASRCLECGCASLYECKLLPLLREYNASDFKVLGKARDIKPDRSNPFIWRDNNKCILCGLCVRTCADIVNVHALGYNGRGFETVPDCAFDMPLLQSECTSCGLCVQNCPTGALHEHRAYEKTPALQLDAKEVTCKYCDNACVLELFQCGSLTIKAIPKINSESCSLGRFLYVLAENNKIERLSSEEKASILKAVCGDLKYYKGESVENFDSILSIINKS